MEEADFFDRIPLMADPDLVISEGAARECVRAFARRVNFDRLSEMEGIKIVGEQLEVVYFREGGVIKAHVSEREQSTGGEG